jgi:hypothetical protein
MQDVALRGFARYLLRLCGEQVQARMNPSTKKPRFTGPAAKELEQAWLRCGRQDAFSSASMYTGPKRAEDSAIDDPHPMGFVVIQVAVLLRDLGQPYASVFDHVFVFGRDPRSFRYDCSSMVEDMVSELALRLESKGEQTIVQSAVDAYRRYERIQRRRAKKQEWEDKNRPSKRVLMEMAS